MDNISVMLIEPLGDHACSVVGGIRMVGAQEERSPHIADSSLLWGKEWI